MPSRRILSGLFVSGVAALCLPVLAATESPVADAAMRADTETLRALLKDGVDANTAQGDGMTALHWTAVNGDLDATQILLYAGANVRATTRLGAYTPLLLASQHGHASSVETLLDAGADVRAMTSTGATSLMLAAASGSADAVTALLARGAEVNARESGRGETALMFAAVFDRVAALDVLLAHGADPTIATNVVDVVEVDKASQEAHRTREERVDVERAELLRAALAELPTETVARELRGREGREEDDASSGGPNVFRRFFAWIIPGSGERNPELESPPRLTFAQLVGKQGGMTPLLFAARQGHTESVKALLAAGADINAPSADGTMPILVSTINGHFELSKYLLDQGADPTIASEAGATPLYAALNMQYAPRTWYPQPTAYLQQRVTYLELVETLLNHGADVNARLTRKLWYSGYNSDLSNVNETGATAFWRAAYASDVEAMRLLVAHGADPNIRTQKAPRRRYRENYPEDRNATEDLSGLPPVPIGGPAVTPLQATAGVGYGFGFAANSHRYHPGGQLRAVKYLVEELGADVNARDHDGYSAVHHAAARGDNEMIEYLVSKGADVTFVSRSGQTTADMANGPVQRIEPFPETIALLVGLGAQNNNNCVSC